MYFYISPECKDTMQKSPNHDIRSEIYNYFWVMGKVIKLIITRNVKEVQVNLIITLSLGSMETDRVIGEPCYNDVIYNRHIAK